MEKFERVLIKTFGTDEAGIQVTGVPNRPMTWSINFYTALKNGGQGRFLKPSIVIENEAVVKVQTPGLAFSRLIDEACLFIQEAAQQKQDWILEKKIRREQRGEQKPTGPQGLGKFSAPMTEEERAEKQRHREQSLAARRSKDAEQRSKMRGK